MSEQDQESIELSNQDHQNPEEGKNRLDILRKVETGEINVDDAIREFTGEKSELERSEILDRLESGEISVQEALSVLEAEPDEEERPPLFEDTPKPLPSRTEAQMRSWWLILLASGLGVVALGGWLGTVGGWWWLCAAPSLVLGLVILAFSLATSRSPWLHLDVDTGQDSWPRKIRLSLPVPIKLTAWALRNWGTRWDALDETAVDELIMALEGNVSPEHPLSIEVHEDKKSGERVQIFLG